MQQYCKDWSKNEIVIDGTKSESSQRDTRTTVYLGAEEEDGGESEPGVEGVEIGKRVQLTVAASMQVMRVEHCLQRYHEKHKDHRVQNHVQQLRKLLPLVPEHPVHQNRYNHTHLSSKLPKTLRLKTSSAATLKQIPHLICLTFAV